MTTRNMEGGKSMLAQAAPFVAPFLAFMLFLSAEGNFPDQHYLLYPLKTILVLGVISYYWPKLPTLVPSATLLSVLVGVLGVVLWVGLDPYLVQYDQPLVGRNPFLMYQADEAWILFAIRVLGISIMVPMMEELFWRGFLMRWLIKEDFTSIPLGTYQHMSFWVTTALFATVHGSEWPLAVIVGILYGFWFVRTKHLGDIMVAHGVTNFLLAFYCLWANDWHFLSIVAPVHK